MAFKDSNGRITIDEVAANKDINNLKSIISLLDDAVIQINEIITNNRSNQGETAKEVNEEVVALKSQINKVRISVEESIDLIDSTISKYQRIDAELRDIISD